ncbi:glycoside hydrolase family 2 protein [Ktedonospora formicarum]|uniref:beta-mannosidase n=1 Tax=Ktedonospora formicarum TaxID=2778364 RepID=A0A8J3I3W1_9CHLR|nr:sugar-binding domain-containing protein [Ktedonospora formicarum]GHO46328.1 beta-mannosidase [Ktedonospora formicarum]
MNAYQVNTYRQIALPTHWEMLAVSPGSCETPEQAAAYEAERWLTAPVPGTVAQALQIHQRWDISVPLNADEQDWWYRCTFTSPIGEVGSRFVLKFDGLASISDIWLNGESILHSENMFLAYEVDVTSLLRPRGEENTLYIRFNSLKALLAKKHPRPRWRTQLTDHQHLRWFRTTLLGRMPGWSPPVQTVGPWRGVTLEERVTLTVERCDVRASLKGNAGLVTAELQARSLVGTRPNRAALHVGAEIFPLSIQHIGADSFTLHGEAQLDEVELWWPHTHGKQSLYPASIELGYEEETVRVDCGRLAFRSIKLLSEHGEFAIHVNGEPIFCRGACWTPLNIVTLTASRQDYEQTLSMARKASMNMLRVGGTMVYEDEAFYKLCDELGILVWQDFMFANMDYPFTDPTFLANVQTECEQILQRLQGHACLAIICGNSEIEQQIAMLGFSEEMWQSDFFEQQLPALCRSYVDTAYWPSSPSGGALPFQANVGNSHYQGVGAYMRPLEDARQSGTRFASECLTFANIPEDQTIDLVLRPGESPTNHPKWKARVPRDHATGWDFDDIRDYYLQQLFRVDPMRLRYTDIQRYLALSRVVSGEVMAYVFAEWRRQSSPSQGGLIWFYRDLWPGAGWGVVDALGHPKAAYYYLQRVLRPKTCFFSDEGVSGLYLHLVNEQAEPINARLELALYRLPGTQVEETLSIEVSIPPRVGKELHVDALLGRFLDLTYAYRFGPPVHDIVVAILSERETGQVLGESFYFPHGLPNVQEQSIGLQAQAALQVDGSYLLQIHTEQFAQAVAINASGYLPEENYFHLYPGGTKSVRLTPQGNKSTLWGSLTTLNSQHSVNIQVIFD